MFQIAAVLSVVGYVTLHFLLLTPLLLEEHLTPFRAVHLPLLLVRVVVFALGIALQYLADLKILFAGAMEQSVAVIAIYYTLLSAITP